MLSKYTVLLLAASFMFNTTARSDDISRTKKLIHLFKRASAEHQLIMTCASNLPKSRELLASGWQSDVERSLKHIRENTNIDTAALENYAQIGWKIDWSMTLEQQQALCGRENKDSWYSKLIRLSTINIVKDTKFIVKYD